MLKLALRPTIPARERYYADPRVSAPRQRTLEANGIDCGASVSAERLRPERVRARAQARIVRPAWSRTRSKPRGRSGASAHSCELVEQSGEPKMGDNRI